MLAGEAVTQETSGMSKGEWREFEAAWGRRYGVGIETFPTERGATARDVIDYLVRNQSTGRLVSRRDIVEALGEDYLQYDQRRLDTQMRRLRRKVQEQSGVKLPVATMRGLGYRFYEAIDVFP